MLVLSAGAAYAQVKDQTFKHWTVYSTTMDGKKLCYMTSYPQEKTGNTKKRSAPYFIVTSINGTTDESSVSSGYPYKLHGKVMLTFDKKQTYWMSLIKDEIAWMKDDKMERELVRLLKRSNALDVKGISTKGTYSVDHYSLAGFSSAYDRMKALCK